MPSELIGRPAYPPSKASAKRLNAGCATNPSVASDSRTNSRRVISITPPSEKLTRHVYLCKSKVQPCFCTDKYDIVLTGSHQPALQAAVSQSLAGRTGILELLPLSIAELSDAGVKKSRDRWMFEGFMPRLYNKGPEPERLYADYFRTYVERDVRQLVNLRNLRQFETFIRLLAGRVAQLLNIDSIAGDAGVSATTVKEWLSLLEASYVIRLLRPYYRNFGKRFIKAPKIYFTETGLVCNLLGIKSASQVAAHPLVGGIFENMVVMEAFKRRLNRGEMDDLYFMRTSHGVEVDLAWEDGGKLDLCEIKAATTFHNDMANNIRAIKRLLPDDAGHGFVVYSGRETATADGIQAMPFTAFDT